MQLPNLTVNMQNQFPFQRKDGKTTPLDNFSFGYSMAGSNRITNDMGTKRGSNPPEDSIVAFNFSNFAHRNLGEVYEIKHDYQAALEIYQHSIDWVKLRENNESQSKPNYAWRLSNSANRCALLLKKFGRQNEAEELLAKPSLLAKAA